MTTTTDPNQLAPLTERANELLHQQTRGLNEFATSSKWRATAVVLQLTEGPEGYEALIGFELCTPRMGPEQPINDTIARLADSRENSVARAVDEFLSLILAPVLAIHSENDPKARLGETPVPAQQRLYTWRMAEGPLDIQGEDTFDVADLTKQLTERPLFDRLDFASILPIEREIPILFLKFQMTRAATPAGDGAVTYLCRTNNNPWPTGDAQLKRFQLPKGRKPLRITQYYCFHRTGRGPLKTPAPTATAVPSKTTAPKPVAQETPAKKPWWKLW